MSRYLALGISCLAIAVTSSSLAATPFIQVVVAEATYLMADSDTLSAAEENVLNRAKRKAIEEVGVYIEASSQDVETEVNGRILRNNSLSVRTIAAAITKTEILDKRRALEGDRLSFYIKIKATVNPAALEEAIKQQHAQEELAEHHRRLSTENTQLKAELDELRNQTRVSRRLSSTSASAVQNQPVQLVGDYRYFYHDPMTAEEAKALAYTEAIRMAIDRSPLFMDATAFIADAAFRRSLVQILAVGYLKDITLVEQSEKNRTVYAKVRGTIDPQDIRSVVDQEVARVSKENRHTPR
jgi:hypothetical protein